MAFYSIGQIHKITGLPIQTLRYYDKIGLFKPDYVNEENKYRYYTEHQFWKIEVINICKQMGVPIKRIAEVINYTSNDDIMTSANSEDIMNILIEQKKEAEAMIKKYLMIIRNVEQYEIDYKKFVLDLENMHEIKEVILEERSIIDGKDDETSRNIYKNMKEVSVHPRRFERGFGYIVNTGKFREGILQYDSEYLILFMKNYINISGGKIIKIPKGRYVSMIINYEDINEEGVRTSLGKLNKYLQEHSYEPQLIIAEELAMPFVPAVMLIDIQILVK